MTARDRRSPAARVGDLIGLPDDRESRVAVFAMMGLYFLVVLAVGILRPVRNALALDGLAEGDFYQVYLVSSLVILFVPLVNRLSNRFPWQRLIPAVALFFAVNLVVFRSVYQEGSTAFGLAFYGWYDLFAAALVAQLFMVTQLFFHARLAKNAYPVVIAGGSLGATLGGGITAFLAARLGTPNLLLLAAVPILVFAVAVPFVWALAKPDAGRAPPRRAAKPEGREGKGQLRAIARDRQVQLIAGMVLVTILVKQIVDYQFNTITKVIYVDRDSVTAIQGWFNLGTQWLPLVALVGMKPLLRRWGVGLVVLILPVAMLLANVSLLVVWGIWAAFAAKGSETTLRYSVERAAREILYVPIPAGIKLKAKNYIDAALEKGVGKMASSVILFLILAVAGLEYWQVAWVGVGLAGVWILMALRVRGEYVKSLARSVEERFASFQGAFASLEDPATLGVVRDALRGDDRKVAFALELLEQAQPEDARGVAEEVAALLEHPIPELRRRAVALLARVPGAVDAAALRGRLRDPDPAVREAAVRAVHAWESDGSGSVVRELLGSDEVTVRTAVLACLARGDISPDGASLEESLRAGAPARQGTGAGVGGGAEVEAGAAGAEAGADERIERALVAAALRSPEAAATLEALMGDPDPRVASVAVRSAGMLGDAGLHPHLVAALGRAPTREAAREALAGLGETALPILVRALLDEGERPAVRRQIPSVLSRIPAPETVRALVECIVAPETDQLLDHRAVKALSKLRARNPDLEFDAVEVDMLMRHSLGACLRYAGARTALMGVGNGEEQPLPVRLLQQAVEEAWEERREEVFRCLGLRHPPEEIHRSYMAVVRGESVPRANALEWLETTVGFHLFRRLAPILDEEARTDGKGDLATLLESLERDQDRWIAHLAARSAVELGLGGSRARDPGPPRLSSLEPTRPEPGRSPTMNVVETVFLLQQIDILRDARSDHLALLATIAEVMDVDADAMLLREGEPGDALYVVVRGTVALTGAGGDLTLSDGKAFGTWALIDDVPSVVGATALEPTRVLRIGREEFHDLLTDHPELALGMLQGLARRIRTLVA